MKKVSLWQLFITFFKTGLFTFGGGYAMISILEEDLVADKKWITSADMLDMLVIAESTPGVIAVNTATSVGYRLRGIWGAIIATLGVVLPSFVIINALAYVLTAFADNVWYQAAFAGIQACVTVLIINAFVKMCKQLNKSWFTAVLLVAAFAVAVFTDFNVIFVILIGGALGLIYTLIYDCVSKKRNKNLPLAQSERMDQADGDDIAEPSNGNNEHCALHNDVNGTHTDTDSERAQDVSGTERDGIDRDGASHNNGEDVGK